MSDVLPFLKSLLAAAGVSAREADVAQLIVAKWTPLVEQISFSKLGSVHALKRGTGTKPRPSVLVAAHMDAIGLIVTRIDGEFLGLAPVGHIDARILPGTAVIVHADKRGEQIAGVVVLPPAALMTDSSAEKTVGFPELLIDVGLTAAQVSKRIAVGDFVSFGAEPMDLSARCISGRSLDNRASIAALTIFLEQLQARAHVWDVWAVASVQEEITYAGASTSAYEIQPTVAVAVDVTFGSGPGANEGASFPLANGPTIGIGPSMHPFLHARFKEIAQRAEIPITIEAVPTESLTDADAMQVTAAGVPTMLVSIPLRYMHTPVEVVSMQDIESAAQLLVEFVTSLEAGFVHSMRWD